MPHTPKNTDYTDRCITVAPRGQIENKAHCLMASDETSPISEVFIEHTFSYLPQLNSEQGRKTLPRVFSSLEPSLTYALPSREKRAKRRCSRPMAASRSRRKRPSLRAWRDSEGPQPRAAPPRARPVPPPAGGASAPCFLTGRRPAGRAGQAERGRPAPPSRHTPTPALRCQPERTEGRGGLRPPAPVPAEPVPGLPLPRRERSRPGGGLSTARQGAAGPSGATLPAPREAAGPPELLLRSPAAEAVATPFGVTAPSSRRAIQIAAPPRAAQYGAAQPGAAAGRLWGPVRRGSCPATAASVCAGWEDGPAANWVSTASLHAPDIRSRCAPT